MSFFGETLFRGNIVRGTIVWGTIIQGTIVRGTIVRGTIVRGIAVVPFFLTVFFPGRNSCADRPRRDGRPADEAVPRLPENLRHLLLLIAGPSEAGS
jgi:hypothetical protein